MGTQKLSEGIKRKILGWKLIGEKYDGKDFNLGDEVVLNMFYDRSNAQLNIIFSLNYGDPNCNEDAAQDVLYQNNQLLNDTCYPFTTPRPSEIFQEKGIVNQSELFSIF